MALLQDKCFKLKSLFARIHNHNFRAFSNVKDIKKSVFISQSNDVFTNMALENWLYTNFDFTHHHVLLLSRNDSSVTIGAHQNPWLDTNIKQPNLKLARRKTTGNAIYQDQGILNMTFFSPREHFNESLNLEFISRALFREYSLKVNRNVLQELMIRNMKVSNTSLMLGDKNVYQQCSILVNVVKEDLIDALHKSESTVKSSVRNLKYMNLTDENYRINTDGLISAVGWEYMRTRALSLKDGGKQLANKQKGFQMINPTDKWFPGLSDMRNELKSWDWNYGKTPKFTFCRTFPIPHGLLTHTDCYSDLSITITVENGRINDVTMFIPPGLSKSGFSGDAKVITSLKGRRFSEEALNSLERCLEEPGYDYIDDKDKFVTDCVKQVMTSL